MGKYQKNIEAARRISVVQYLETYHPGELVRKTDKEYCTKTHSSLVITPANGLFHWFSQSKGGNNALDYLVKVEGMDFVSAVRLLNEMTPMPVSVQTVKEAPVQQQTSRPFVLPPADRNTEAATSYLMHRGISPKVLRYCVGSGILYQTTRGNYRNCVFVGKDENGVPHSAFQRGCQGSFRGDVAGSQKQYGFLIPAESEACDTVEIYEAPIDAMSGATLRQYKHDSPWRSVHYLALGGLNHQPIDYFLQRHPEVKRVSLCFDRDDPGRNFTKIAAKRLAERGYIIQDTPPAIGKLKTTPAVELSYLTPEEQEDFLSYMESEGCTPSLSQAQKLKEASKESVLTPEKIQHIMAAKSPSVKPRDPQLMIPVAKVERYFPKGFTSDQMQQVIVKLLENYARAHQHGSR